MKAAAVVYSYLVGKLYRVAQLSHPFYWILINSNLEQINLEVVANE